jgi:Tfp pilus assembly protein PilO
MTGFLDRLNLRPFEKRMVVGLGAVLFVIINAWFVFPHFSDLADARDRKAKAEEKLKRWQTEVDQAGKYKAAITKLAGESLEVAPEDQVNQFANAYQIQAVQSGVDIKSTTRPNTRTNEFFLELTQTIGAESVETNLVDFLYNLGATKSLIRIRGLSLRTDPQHQKLVANVTMAASYQKSPPKKPATATPPGATKASPATAKRP